MEAQLRKLHNLFNAQAQRERIFLLLIFLGIIYLLWYYLLANALWQKQNDSALDFSNAQRLLAGSQLQINSYKQGNSLQLQQEYQRLTQQIEHINYILNQNKKPFVLAIEKPLVLKSLLYHSQALTLTDFENPSAATNKSGSNSIKHVTQNDFLLKFNGNYFTALQYFQTLENLPWRFYWDALDYQVTDYPVAQITLKLHTLNLDEG